MESLSELDQLNLDPAAKTQVASLIQSLLEQRQRDAEQLQAKDHEIPEKDFKIQALSHELAHIRRLRYGVKNESLGPLNAICMRKPWTRIWWLSMLKLSSYRATS